MVPTVFGFDPDRVGGVNFDVLPLFLYHTKQALVARILCHLCCHHLRVSAVHHRFGSESIALSEGVEDKEASTHSDSVCSHLQAQSGKVYGGVFVCAGGHCLCFERGSYPQSPSFDVL